MATDAILDRAEEKAEERRDVDLRRDEIIAAMRQMSEEVAIPGQLNTGDIIHRGTAELDAQMIVGKGKGPAIIPIWDTRTGEKSRAIANMLPTQMSKTREDGSQVFTTVDPGIVPVRGTLKCMLHSADPNRATYDRWGLATCRKANLPSRQDVKTHMQNRHKREWATIEEDRIRIEREEERELRRASIAQSKASLASLQATSPALGNDAGDSSLDSAAPRTGARKPGRPVREKPDDVELWGAHPKVG